MLTTEALVSGSLGQAIYRCGRTFQILDAPEADPREALPHEIYAFRDTARELALVSPDGSPVSVDEIRERLKEEIRVFIGLDNLLIGMDPDFSDILRRKSICFAEQALHPDDSIARRIRTRFLVPFDVDDWDPAGALEMALNQATRRTVACYRVLAEQIIDTLAADLRDLIAEADQTERGSIVSETIWRSGLLAELALIETQGEVAGARSASQWRIADFPGLPSSDLTQRIFDGLIQRVDALVVSTSSTRIWEDLMESFEALENKAYVHIPGTSIFENLDNSVTLATPYAEFVPPDVCVTSVLPSTIADLINDFNHV